jgi:hypothetical protein
MVAGLRAPERADSELAGDLANKLLDYLANTGVQVCTDRKGPPVLILKYVLWVVFFACAFLLGSLIEKQSGKLAGIVTHRKNPPSGVCKLFRYSGDLIQIVAAIWGFIDFVAVLVLVF